MEQNFEDWIGRSATRLDVVTERLLAEYRATLSPYLFETSENICPPGFHFGLAPAISALQAAGPDGAERKGMFLPPIQLPRRMWAGGSIETIRPLRLGQKVCRASRIADIGFKRGSSGELCLVSLMHDISDQDGMAIRERQDLVFREAASMPSSLPAESGPIEAEVMVDASPLLLFRFSAFTFNGHRIHYDLAHAAEEGYPNLLVHGPLQAVLMLNLAARRLNGTPGQFVYRCLAPLYGGTRFGVSFDRQASRARMIRGDGVTAAEGQALSQGTG